MRWSCLFDLLPSARWCCLLLTICVRLDWIMFYVAIKSSEPQHTGLKRWTRAQALKKMRIESLWLFVVLHCTLTVLWFICSWYPSFCTFQSSKVTNGSSWILKVPNNLENVSILCVIENVVHLRHWILKKCTLFSTERLGMWWETLKVWNVWK